MPQPQQQQQTQEKGGSDRAAAVERANTVASKVDEEEDYTSPYACAKVR